jgi:mRNA interferase RelE/StbE
VRTTDRKVKVSMTYYIDMAPAAEKSFSRLDPEIKRRMQPRIDALAEDPIPHNAVTIQGNQKNIYRIRVGDYRIVYTVSHERQYVYVTLIGHRSTVYRDL